MKKIELENGNLLREAVKKSNEIRNEENLTRVIQLLRDSHVWVPCIAKLGQEDQKQWEDKIMSGENIIGQTLTTKEEIHFKPDILQSGEELFFPIFSNAEAMGDYGNGFSKIEMHFMEAVDMALSYDVVGMVLDAFSESFVIEKENYEIFLSAPTIIEDEKDPIVQALEINAEESLLFAARLFNVEAMKRLGDLYWQEDPGKALEFYEEASKRKDMHSYVRIADAYRFGKGYAKDVKRAIFMYNDLYHFLKDNNMMEVFPEILIPMGEIYYYGLNQPVDLGEAIYFFNQARLLMKDNKKAEKLFSKAADKLFNDFKLKPMKKFIFRKFLNKTIYIYNKTKYFDGVLAFGYVDHEKGLCFRILCPATFNKEEQAFGNPFKDVTLTYKELESYSFLEMDYRVPGPVAEHINPIIDEVYNVYSTNPDLHELRYTVDIDVFRNKYHPDLVEVTLQDNKKMLARTETIEDGYIVVSTGKDRFKIEVNKGELLPLID